MSKLKNLSLVVSGVIMGGLLLTGGLAFAASDSSIASQAANLANKLPSMGQKMGHRGGMGDKGGFRMGGPMLAQEKLDQLVKDSVITQAKATEIKTFLDNKQKEQQAKFAEMQKLTAEERKALFEKNATTKQKTTDQSANEQAVKPAERPDFCTELVTNKILTQEQATAIRSKLNEYAQQDQQLKISDSLKTLVEKGTITQAQADKIVKAATQDPLDALVSAGDITQVQATAVGEVLPFGRGHRGGRR